MLEHISAFEVERILKSALAETGVDLISIGALTHSVKALDISLKFSWD